MIVYTVICRSKDASILVEVSSEALTGNAPQVTTALLEHLRDHPTAMKEGDLKTFVHRNEKDGDDFFSQFMHACTIAITSAEELDLGVVQEHYFHLWHVDGVFYCCLSDDADTRDQKVNFAYLQALALEFSKAYTKRRIKKCNAYAMDKEFGTTVRSTMHYYNTNHKRLSRDQQVERLLAQVEDMKTVLGRNLHLLLEREDKLNRLVEKSEMARRDSMVFKKRSIILKDQYRVRNNKFYALLAGLIIVIFYTILTAACGVRFQYCRANGNGTDSGEGGD